MRWFHRERPVYVVAGFRRSGTTMLMQALEAGGVRVDIAPAGAPDREYYELSHDQRAHGWPDYEHPERTELPYTERFPVAHKGRAIKCLSGMAQYLAPIPAGYVVVFIHRSPDAISRSAAVKWGYGFRADDIARSVAADLLVWRDRTDCPVTLVELDYDDVLRDPIAAMQQLQAAGFPIRHVNRAAKVIDGNRPHLQVVA